MIGGIVGGMLAVLSLNLAQALWGIEGSGTHSYPHEHPFRLHVVNRSQTPVLLDAVDATGHRWSVFLIDRERDYLDLSAPVGTTIPVTVRPLTADGPGSRPGLIEWEPVAGMDLHVVIDPDGQPKRTWKSNGSDDVSMISVRSEHDLPVRVGWDMAPGNGGMYMPDARDREDSCWVGTGVSSFTGGMGVRVGEPASLTYSIPGVRANAAQIEIEAGADREMEVAIGRNGRVEAHAMTLWPSALKALKF